MQREPKARRARPSSRPLEEALAAAAPKRSASSKPRSPSSQPTGRSSNAALIDDDRAHARRPKSASRPLESALDTLTAARRAIRRSLEARRERHRRGAGRPAAHGPPPAAGRARAAGGHAGGGPRLDAARRRAARAARRDRGARGRSRRARPLCAALSRPTAARWSSELADLSREQERIAALVAARQSRLAEAEQSFGAERAKARRARPRRRKLSKS